MDRKIDSGLKQRQRRRVVQGAAAAAAAGVLGAPFVSRAQAKPIKVGMPTILSGRVAQLGTSSRNAVMIEVEKFNAAGGLGGRPIEMVVRDSKGQPQEAARVSRELVQPISGSTSRARVLRRLWRSPISRVRPSGSATATRHGGSSRRASLRRPSAVRP